MLATRDDLSEVSCPLTHLTCVLGSKWALPLLYWLVMNGAPMRFGELRRVLAPITQKELTRVVRHLEQLGLVSRTVFAQVPPRVEYAPTALAESLRGPMAGLAAWAHVHGPELAARA